MNPFTNITELQKDAQKWDFFKTPSFEDKKASHLSIFNGMVVK